jgi:2-oxoglutarate ferredoxin oxidoreductase subunit delta
MAKGTVFFDQDLCKGCGLCIEACPVKIVSIDNSKINNKGYNPAIVNDMDKCIGCTNCATMCPDSVITVERD